MIPEFAPQRAVWLQWPTLRVSKGVNERDFVPVFVEIERECSTEGEVNNIVLNSHAERMVKQKLANAGVSLKNIFFHIMPYDSCWIRDNGPIFVRKDGQEHILDFGFNAWGYAPWGPYDRDDEIPQRIAKLLGIGCTQVRYVDYREGGKVKDLIYEDKTDPQNCTVIYRPSFGRRGGLRRAEFGEFDAIIVTPQIAYLIESKWDGSKASFPNNVLKLEDVQTRRHEIFRWYHESWKGESWSEFVKKHAQEFKETFGKNIAREDSLLSNNLKTTLKQMQGRKLVNVLLFLYRRETPKIQTNFKVVTIKYEPTNEEYIELK